MSSQTFFLHVFYKVLPFNIALEVLFVIIWKIITRKARREEQLMSLLSSIVICVCFLFLQFVSAKGSNWCSCYARILTVSRLPDCVTVVSLPLGFALKLITDFMVLSIADDESFFFFSILFFLDTVPGSPQTMTICW